jgi:hypothetical protein
VAVVRAELRVAAASLGGSFDQRAPASWAVVEASLGAAVVGRALADAGGRMMMTFPYPKPAPTVTPAHWSLTFHVRFAAAETSVRADLDRARAAPATSLRPWGSVPFAPTLTRELRPNQSIDLGALELQP